MASQPPTHQTTRSNLAKQRLSIVQFHLIVPVEVGTSISVLGSTAELGNWGDKQKHKRRLTIVPMVQTAVPSVWSSGRVHVLHRDGVQYKLVHGDDGGLMSFISPGYLHWEADPNRDLLEGEHQFCFSFRPKVPNEWYTPTSTCCSALAASDISNGERAGLFTEFLLAQFLTAQEPLANDGRGSCVNERIRSSAVALRCLFKQAARWQRPHIAPLECKPLHALMRRFSARKEMAAELHLRKGLAALLCVVVGHSTIGLGEEGWCLAECSGWIAELLTEVALAQCQELPDAEQEGAHRAVRRMVVHNRSSGGLESAAFLRWATRQPVLLRGFAIPAYARMCVVTGPCSASGSTSSCSLPNSKRL
jgi:hypothetical protein